MDARRKLAVAKRLAANYNSLPSVVCDDFFNSYANCLLGRETNSRNNREMGSSTGSSRNSKIKIAVQVSQVKDGNRGRRRIVRHHLTQVKEEDYDDEPGDDDLVNYECSSSIIDNDQQRGSSVRRIIDNSRPNPKSREDFHMFLRSQMSGRTGRSKVRLYQGSRTKREDSTSVQTGRNDNCAQPLGEPKCYELFCVHQASLLVHRSQILVEAERLARRLAQLTD